MFLSNPNNFQTKVLRNKADIPWHGSVRLTLIQRLLIVNEFYFVCLPCPSVQRSTLDSVGYNSFASLHINITYNIGKKGCRNVHRQGMEVEAWQKEILLLVLSIRCVIRVLDCFLLANSTTSIHRSIDLRSHIFSNGEWSPTKR